MYHDQLKHLWKMRFRKIFETEKDSFQFYKSLLMKNKTLLKGTKIKLLIRQLMRDEIQHARMARQLLRMVDGKVEKSSKRLGMDAEINL